VHTLIWSAKEQTKIAREQKQAMPACWNIVTDELDRLFQTGQNVIISIEGLARVLTFNIPTGYT
jgi:hypothetical protein